MNLLKPVALIAVAASFALPVVADHHAKPMADVAVMQEDGVRVMTASVEAEIVAIDLDTREVTLKGPDGNMVTIHAREQIVKLEDLKIGDKVVSEYLVALEGELREPTEEELANPWVVISDKASSMDVSHPAVGAARQIRAVCTIEAADREQGYVMVKDARGKMHTITGVEPEKFDGVSLGDTVVFVYTEALALSIEHSNATSM